MVSADSEVGATSMAPRSTASAVMCRKRTDVKIARRDSGTRRGFFRYRWAVAGLTPILAARARQETE